MLKNKILWIIWIGFELESYPDLNSALLCLFKKQNAYLVTYYSLASCFVSLCKILVPIMDF